MTKLKEIEGNKLTKYTELALSNHSILSTHRSAWHKEAT